MISPTGLINPRKEDKHGSGAFASGRGTRSHYGLDMICVPGQSIVAPHDGLVKRTMIAYPDTQKFKGIELVDDTCISQLLYVSIKSGVIGKEVLKGDVIGYAQKISDRYEGITEHIHWQIYYNPILFL